MPTYNENILPSSTGFDLGNSTQRWDGFFQSLVVSGLLTAQSLSAIRFADQFTGATVTNQLDAAIADLGSSVGVVVVPSSLGTGNPTSVPNNVTLIDLRGTAMGTPYGNGITINGQTTGVHSMMRVSNQRTNPDRSEEVITVVGQFSGAMPGSGTDSVQAVTGVSQTYGAITTAAVVNIAAVEGGADLNSTGGTITAAIGVNGWANTEVGSTTTVGKLVGVLGQAPIKNGTGTITEAYGGEFVQSAAPVATTVAAIHAQGNILMDNATALQMKDSGGAVRAPFQSDTSNNVFLSDIGGFIRFQNKDATAIYARMSAGNAVEIDPAATGVQLKLSTPNGTAPIVATSTTPVANLTCTPITYNAAGVQRVGVHAVTGQVTLAGGTAIVTLTGAAVFTANTTYFVTATNNTAPNAIQVVQTDATHFTLSSSGATDVVNWIAIGN